MVGPINAGGVRPQSIQAPRPAQSTTPDKGGAGGATKSPTVDRVSLSSEGREQSAGVAALMSATIDRATSGGDGNGTASLIEATAQSESAGGTAGLVEAAAERQAESSEEDTGGTAALIQNVLKRAQAGAQAAYDASGSSTFAAAHSGQAINIRA